MNDNCDVCLDECCMGSANDWLQCIKSCWSTSMTWIPFLGPDGYTFGFTKKSIGARATRAI